MNKSQRDQLPVSLSVIFLDNVTLNTVCDLGTATHIKSDTMESLHSLLLKSPLQGKFPFLPWCWCSLHCPCFTPATYAAGPHVWLGLCDPRNSLINSRAALWCWQRLSSMQQCSGQNEDTHLQLITHRQTNKCGLWVCGDGVRMRGAGRGGQIKWNWGDRASPRGVPAVSFETVLCFSYQISAMSAEATEREAPCPPRPGGKTAEWTFRQTSERLAVSHTAQPVESTAESMPDRQEDRGRESDGGQLQHACLLNSYVCTHSSEAIGFWLLHACVCVWMTEPATQTLSKATL